MLVLSQQVRAKTVGTAGVRARVLPSALTLSQGVNRETEKTLSRIQRQKIVVRQEHGEM